MKHTAEQVMSGIINYADAEVMNKLSTSGKWVAGTAIAIATKKANNIIETLMGNSIVEMLELVDDEGYIDTDMLMSALKESANKYGKITIDVPLVGRMSFSASDVDILSNYFR